MPINSYENIEPVMSIDAVGFFCPEPILRIRDAIESVQKGDVVELLADDPTAKTDITQWAKDTDNELLLLEEESGEFRFLIRKN